MDLPLFFALPLIGGFAFVTRFFLFRWRSGRQDAQRLYYRAAVFGLGLAVAAALAHVALLEWSRYRAGFDWLYTVFLQPLLSSRDSSPAGTLLIRGHVALVCVYALLFGIIFPTLINPKLLPRKYRKSSLININLKAITDPLERLLSDALLNGDAVQITLSSGKVYVGYVLEALDPELPTKFVKLQPLMSGQRGSDGQVTYTTFYDQVLSDFARNPDTPVAVALFQQVIPVDKVVTLSGFSLDAYVHFLVEGDATATDGATDLSEPHQLSAASVVSWVGLVAAVIALLRR